MRTRQPLAATLARSGLPGALLLTVLLLGVVAMHAMSGSATHHGPGHLLVGHVEVGPGAVAHPVGDPAASDVPGPGGTAHAPAQPVVSADQVSDAVDLGAMCLMVLVTLLAVPPPRPVLLVVRRPHAGERATHRRGERRHGPVPNLHALGISRT